MKAKNLTIALTTLAATSLLPLAGAAFAADAHDSYHRSFYGDGTSHFSTQPSDAMGRAAYGNPSDTSTWSAHDAYRRAFPGDGGPSYSKPETNAMGKAAYGSSSTTDGLAAYRNAFNGD